jgi:uncharacterized protein
MQLSRYLVAGEPFREHADGPLQRAVLATRTGQAVVLPDRLWNALVAGDLDAVPPAVRSELGEIEALVPADEDELAAILHRNDVAAEQDQDLYVVIQPTANCQLGCDYCGQEHVSQRIGRHEQDLLVLRTGEKLRHGSYSSLSICWFGAEPLAGLSTMRRLSPRLIGLAADHGCEYNAKIVTNGLALNRRVARELVDRHRVGFVEITLDGAQPEHDARRHTKHGAPTFDRIFHNLLGLCEETEVPVRVRCNVDARNQHGVRPLLEQLAAPLCQRPVRRSRSRNY